LVDTRTPTVTLSLLVAPTPAATLQVKELSEIQIDRPEAVDPILALIVDDDTTIPTPEMFKLGTAAPGAAIFPLINAENLKALYEIVSVVVPADTPTVTDVALLAPENPEGVLALIAEVELQLDASAAVPPTIRETE